MRLPGRSAALSLACLLAACAFGSDPEGERARTAALEPAPPTSSVPPLSTRDINGDGLISAGEAAGYYARRFGELDQDGDAYLSRSEMGLEIDALEDPDAEFEGLDTDSDLIISQDEYFEANSERYLQRVEPTTGMMSSSDFDEMIRFSDPEISDELDGAGARGS